jgi:anthranilate 1,2-dioxygenase large subunit/terephthalate 1,2-dioxygenase oxygenase component alpha subunit
MQERAIHWKSGANTRIPYGLYVDELTRAQEEERIFRGAVWNYLCLDTELPQPGCYRTTHAGVTPVIVARDGDGEIYAFENRCAHRGALIALDKAGQVENFQCVYHAWSYNRQGDLTGVAFEKGVKGQGGMPDTFCKEAHGPRKLRVATFCGLVFGSFSDDVPDIEDYLGPEICARIERVLHKPVEVIGR